MEVNQTSKRMLEFITQRGISVRNCAEAIGVSQRTLAGNLKDGAAPSIETVRAFAIHFGLSLNWLINGNYPVFIENVQAPAPAPYHEPKVNDTYNINIGHSTQTVDQTVEQPQQQPAPAISADTALLVKQLIEQNHQLYEQNVLLMDQNRSLSEQLIKLINK